MIWHAVLIALPNPPVGNSVWNAVFAGEMRRCLHDVGFHPQDVRERLVACRRGRLRELRPAQELIGVGERDGAGAAAGERAEIARAHDHAIGGKRPRHRPRRERARQPAVLQVLLLSLAGIPDLDRPEMREIGARIADALQHREPPVLPDGSGLALSGLAETSGVSM